MQVGGWVDSACWVAAGWLLLAATGRCWPLLAGAPCLPTLPAHRVSLPIHLQVLAITFPSTFGGLHNRTHTVVAAPGTQQDEAFVESVFEVGG